MPGNLLDADTSFPEIRGKRQEDINRELLNYLGMLLEQLRYSFGNIGLENFNEKEFEHISEIIQEPIYARLKDEEGNLAELSATAQGLIGRISDAEGSLTKLAATAQGLATEVSDVSGKYTRLQQTVEGFTFQDDEGKVWINNGSINLTGSITFNDLDSSVRSAVNNRGISAATAESIAHTAISADLVASPTIMGAEILGGKFENLDKTYWLELGNTGHDHVLRLYNATQTSVPVFSVGETNGFIYLNAFGYPYLTTENTGGYTVSHPMGTWNFSGATVTGLKIA